MPNRCLKYRDTHLIQTQELNLRVDSHERKLPIQQEEKQFLAFTPSPRRL